MFNKFLIKLLNLDGLLFQFNWIAAGAAIGGALLNRSATRRAAQTQSETARLNREEQARQFDITQEQFEPFRTAGTGEFGLQRYTELVGQENQGNIPGQFQFGAEEFQQYKDPGYEFRVGEGLRALDRRLARGGKRGAGVRSRALMDLGQNLASQEFGAARGRALQDYTSEVSREQSQYQRGYLDPLARAGQLTQMGMGVTQNLASGRASYADRLSQINSANSRVQSAAILGNARTTSAAIGAMGQAYQNSSNEPDYSTTSGQSDYGRYTDSGSGPVISRENYTG